MNILSRKRKKPEKEAESLHLAQCLRQLFEDCMDSTLGSSPKTAIIYHVKKKLDCDPFQALTENPCAFYNALKSVLGEGANFTVKIFAAEISRKYAVNITPETLLKYMRSEDPALINEWQTLLNKIFNHQENMPAQIEAQNITFQLSIEAPEKASRTK